MKLIAKRELSYGGKTYLAGETFETSESHGKILKIIKRAADAPPPVEPAPPPPAHAPPRVRTRAVVAADPPPARAPDPPPVETATADSGVVFGRYGRRDLQAKDT